MIPEDYVAERSSKGEGVGLWVLPGKEEGDSDSDTELAEVAASEA